MNRNLLEESAWQQYFPTYHFEERDVALEEYRSASKTLEAEERVFLNVSNIAIIVAAAFASLAVGKLGDITEGLTPLLSPMTSLVLFILVVVGFSIVTLRYFADRQKAIVYAARKVIVLRRMLGLSYGHFRLVLPNWRVEGADQPFAVRLFPGWNTYVAYPLYMIGGISVAVVTFIESAMLRELLGEASFSSLELQILLGVSLAAWIGLLATLYRKALLDTHERMSLLFTQSASRFLRLKLVNNFENVIYRARLAFHEGRRLRLDLSEMRKMLVFVEDQTFFSHPGVSMKGICRAALGSVGLKRRSGGSTVTQQLARTLFIEEYSKIWRRKVIEILLSLWLDRVLSKEEQLDLYFGAVRFERGIYGVPEAMNHFFGRVIEDPSPAQAFFLVERISNARSRLLVERVAQIIRSAVSKGLLSREDASGVVRLYRDAVSSGRTVLAQVSDIDNLESLIVERDSPTA